jgi:hypothetical protein
MLPKFMLTIENLCKLRGLPLKESEPYLIIDNENCEDFIKLLATMGYLCDGSVLKMEEIRSVRSEKFLLTKGSNKTTAATSCIRIGKQLSPVDKTMQITARANYIHQFINDFCDIIPMWNYCTHYSNGYMVFNIDDPQVPKLIKELEKYRPDKFETMFSVYGDTYRLTRNGGNAITLSCL